MDTFWPTVGTVFNFGAGEPGRKSAFTCSWKVVFPALSRPRRRTEYSAEVSGIFGEDLEMEIGGGDGGGVPSLDVAYK